MLLFLTVSSDFLRIYFFRVSAKLCALPCESAKFRARAHVTMCLAWLRAHVPMCLATSRSNMLTCLESLASHGLYDHVITYQHVLPPQEVVLMPIFSVLLSLLLKLCKVLVRFKSLINLYLSNMNSYIIEIW